MVWQLNILVHDMINLLYYNITIIELATNKRMRCQEDILQLLS